jgi:hypothetical protein
MHTEPGTHRGLRGLRVHINKDRVPEVSPTIAVRFVGIVPNAVRRRSVQRISAWVETCVSSIPQRRWSSVVAAAGWTVTYARSGVSSRLFQVVGTLACRKLLDRFGQVRVSLQQRVGRNDLVGCGAGRRDHVLVAQHGQQPKARAAS